MTSREAGADTPPSPRLLLRLVLFSILVKVALLAGLGNGVADVNGDAFSYLEPLDRLLDGGPYTYAINHLPAYAGRMPGYSVIYLPLRASFPRELAAYGATVFQAVLDGVAAVALALLAWHQARTRLAFGVVYVAYVISTQVSSWNHRLLTESPAASSAILAAWLVARGIEGKGRRNFLAAGFFVAWCVFLKPLFILPFFLALAVLLLRRWPGINLNGALLVLAPFVVAETLWVTRNLVVLNAFVPSQYDANAGYQHRRSFLALMSFVQDLGGDLASWNPKAEIRWFDEFAGQTRRAPPNYMAPPPMPSVIESSGIPRSELFETRRLVLMAGDPSLSEKDRDLADRRATQRLEAHRVLFARSKPLRRWVIAPLRITLLYLLQSGTTNLFSDAFSSLSLGQKAFKLSQSGLYILSAVLGVPAAMVFLSRFLRAPTAQSGALVAPAVLFFFFALAFPLVMRRAEYRYFVPGYPFGLALSSLLVLENAGRWRRLRGLTSPVA